MKTAPSPQRDQRPTPKDAPHPDPALGANFDQPAPPFLTFSTKSRIWGDRSGKAMEPAAAPFAQQGLKQQTLKKHQYRCHYCGFPSIHNQVHNLNDNHDDLRDDNLQPVDQLCHGWQHLGELDSGDAVIAYLPGLSGQDVNHLQRTLLVALHAGDDAMRADARKLMNWLASHRSYTSAAWGTYEPATFAAALMRQSEPDRDKREIVFSDLALIFGPRRYDGQVAAWARDYDQAHPPGQWAQIHHTIVNAPL